MAKANEIPTGELFADLQVSLTEIFLIENLGDEELIYQNASRLDGNIRIRESILRIMRERFSREDIENFLENGYPRAVHIERPFFTEMT